MLIFIQIGSKCSPVGLHGILKHSWDNISRYFKYSLWFSLSKNWKKDERSRVLFPHSLICMVKFKGTFYQLSFSSFSDIPPPCRCQPLTNKWNFCNYFPLSMENSNFGSHKHLSSFVVNMLPNNIKEMPIGDICLLFLNWLPSIWFLFPCLGNSPLGESEQDSDLASLSVESGMPHHSVSQRPLPQDIY